MMERSLNKEDEISQKINDNEFTKGNGQSDKIIKMPATIAGGFAVMAIIKRYKEGYPIKIHSLGIELNKDDELKEEGEPS